MTGLVRGRGRRATTTLAVVTVPAVVAVLAFAGRGFPLARVDLNDGGVWLTATSQLKLGRFNSQVEELNGGLVTTGSSFDVEQDGSDVLLVEQGTVSVVDPANVTATTQVAAPGATTRMAGGTVAIVDTKGDLYVRTVAGLAGLQVGTDPADVALGDGGRAVVATDGTALGVAADGTVTRVTTVGTAPGAHRVGRLREDAAPDQLTAVGDQPVTLTDHTLHTLHGDVELDGDGLTLQEPGPASSRVLVASTTALLEVPLDGGKVVAHPNGGAGGTPAAPVQVGSCAHAAWSSATGSYLRLCGGHQQRRDLEGVTSGDHLRFRVNRGVVVLNDTVAGRVWMPAQDAKVRVPNWQDIVPQEQPDQSDQQKDSSDTTQNLVTDCSSDQSPPSAADDSFGVRPGRTTVLPVVDNDSTSDCAILVISQFDQIPTDFGTVQAIYGGRALQVAVAPGASGSVDFTYTITDGHGTSAPSTAHVHLTVSDQAVDRAPTQTRVGLLQVEQGGQTQQDVLANFSDPDGDDLLLVGASADPAAGTVRFKQDGSLTFVASTGARLGRSSVTLQVSDGQETTTGTLDVEVRPSGSVPPRIDPVHAVTYVDQPVVVKPLDAVRSTSAEPARLAAVTDVQGATITPDLAAGTFTFSSARAGSYYVQFTVVAAPQQGTGLARIDVLPRPEQAQPPVAVRDAAFLPAGGQTTIDPLANDSDPAGNVLVLQDVAVPPASGLKVAVIEHHLVQIRAQRTLEAPVSLAYTISNGNQTAQGEIVVHPVPPSATSQPPVVPNVEADVRTGGIVTIPVLDTAYDPDGDDITLQGQLPEPPAAGQGLMFVSGDVLRYQAPDTPMTVRATFAVQDPSGNVTAAQVTVHVHASDASSKAPPRPRDLEARAFAGDTVRIQVPLVGIDPDGDGVTLLGEASAPAQGRIVDSGPDWLEFQAYDDAVGTDSFTYAVEDWTGQRAVATVRVGITPRPLGASSVVTRDDTVTVRPGQTVEVRVLANDVDSSGAELTLDPQLEMPAGTDAKVDGGRIVVHAPAKPGTIQIAYTARDERGGHDTGILTVTVSDDAPVLAPIARDVVVPATQTIDHTEVAVDVLAVAQNPSGPLSDLAVRVPPQFADVARVDPVSRKVVVTLVDHTLTVPFMLVNTTAPEGAAQSYAFITVPALGFFPPTPRPKAPELRVASGQPLVIPLDEQVQVAPGRSPSIADPLAVTATRSDGASLVKSSTQLQFTSAKGYAGPASITVPVTDARSAGDTSAHTAVITLPITVFAVDEHPPTFDAAVLDVAPGEDPLTVDLRALTHGPEGASGSAAEYTYTITDATPAGFTASLHGSVLTVGAAATTPKGRTDQLKVRIGYGQTGHVDVQVPLRVIASTRRTALVLDQTVSDGQEGVPTTVKVLDGAFNPFPSDPLTVVGATVETPDAGSASVTGSTVTVRPAVGFIGQMVTRFTVRDVTNDPDRAVEGRITVVVRGKPAVPGTPQVVSIGNKSVVLSWPTPDNRGAPITGYRVVASPGGAVTDCPATTCTIDGLTNDTEYTFTVAARNEIGTSDASAPSASARPDTVPDAPDAPVLAFGDRQVAVTWNAPHSDGSPVTGYTLQISPAPAKGPATVDTTSTSYTFDGLTNGTAYQVQVRAKNRAPQPGPWSPWSQAAVPAAAPDAPQVTATPTDSRAGRLLQVQWTPPAANGDPIAQYEVTITGGDSPVVVDVPAAQTSYVFTDARTRTPYTVSVRAQNKAGWGAAGQTTASTFGLPDPPSSVSAQALAGQGAVQVSWSGADGNGTPVTGYVVSVSDGQRITVGPQQSVRVGGLDGGTAYTFTVQTQNQAGLSSSSPAASAQASTPPDAPGSPAIDVTKANGANQPLQVTVSWSASAENGGGQATYFWTLTGDAGRRQTGSTTALSAVVDVNGWVAPTGTTLRLTVYAQTAAAQGASSSVNATLNWGSAPGAPTSLAVASPDADTLKATWGAPVDDGGVTIDAYTVCWALSTTPGNQRCSDVDGTTYSATEPLADVGAQAGSVVKVTVVAHNSRGDGPTASLSYTVPPAGP